MSTLVFRKQSIKLFLLALAGLLFIYLGYQHIYVTLPAWSITNKPAGQPTAVPPPATTPPTSVGGSIASAGQPADIPVAAVGVSAKNNGPEFFAEYRLERDRVRSQQVEILREVINNPSSTTENRRDAQQKMINLTNSLQKEMELENLLMAKGFRDAVAMLQPNNVTVVVLAKSLTPEEVTRISDLVCRTTSCKPEQVVIIPKG